MGKAISIELEAKRQAYNYINKYGDLAKTKAEQKSEYYRLEAINLKEDSFGCNIKQMKFWSFVSSLINP